MTKSTTLLAVVLTLVTISATVQGRLVGGTLVTISATVQGRLVGGRMYMGDVSSNKEVQELGRFSVDHYNRLQMLGEEEPLRFVKVVEAQTQVVAGIKYYLKVETLHGGRTRVFDAQVVVKPWLPACKDLLSFSPSTKPLY